MDVEVFDEVGVVRTKKFAISTFKFCLFTIHFSSSFANAMRLSNLLSLKLLAVLYNSVALVGFSISVSKKSVGVIFKYSQI